MKKNNLNLYNEKEFIPGIYAQEIFDIENTLHAINQLCLNLDNIKGNLGSEKLVDNFPYVISSLIEPLLDKVSLLSFKIG